MLDQVDGAKNNVRETKTKYACCNHLILASKQSGPRSGYNGTKNSRNQTFTHLKHSFSLDLADEE